MWAYIIQARSPSLSCLYQRDFVTARSLARSRPTMEMRMKGYVFPSDADRLWNTGRAWGRSERQPIYPSPAYESVRVCTCTWFFFLPCCVVTVRGEVARRACCSVWCALCMLRNLEIEWMGGDGIVKFRVLGKWCFWEVMLRWFSKVLNG